MSSSDRSTFDLKLGSAEVVRRLDIKARTPGTGMRRAYLTSPKYHEPHYTYMYKIPAPIAGIMSIPVKIFGRTMITIIRDMLATQINQL